MPGINHQLLKAKNKTLARSNWILRLLLHHSPIQDIWLQVRSRCLRNPQNLGSSPSHVRSYPPPPRHATPRPAHPDLKCTSERAGNEDARAGKVPNVAWRGVERDAPLSAASREHRDIATCGHAGRWGEERCAR